MSSTNPVELETINNATGIQESAVLSQTRKEFEQGRARRISFVDSSLPGHEALALSLGEGSQVYVLENNSDAFAQIEAALAAQTDPASSVHIYSHGSEGAIYLGGSKYDAAALDACAATLARIGKALAEGADIMLYGCNTGAGSLGETFLERMARLSGVDVAASTNVTGSNGDWVLEKNVGQIESESLVPEWQGNLDASNISSWGIIEGAAGSSVTGSVLSDRIYANGSASLAGGRGNDVYYINKENEAGGAATAVTVTENKSEGSDTVVSQVRNLDLSGSNEAEIEFIGLEAQDGMTWQSVTGNDFSQTIAGNALDNKLVGGGGRNALYGYDGDDYLDGGNGNLGENPGYDYNNGNNSTMVGGKGDDIYIVRNAGDVVTELVNQGTDEVYSFVDQTLAANVENLTLLDGQNESTSAKIGVGNTLNNVLTGNKYANLLSGEVGNDTLHGSRDGDKCFDTLDGGAGNDAYYIYREGENKYTVHGQKLSDAGDKIVDSAGVDSIYSTVNYDLNNAATVEQLFLSGDANVGIGNKLNNRIVGNASKANTLEGGSGNNTLEGGTGADLFILRGSGDMVIDNGGADTIKAFATVDLNRYANANIEKVELQDADQASPANFNANLNATAKRTFASYLVGNSGNNVLTGGNEADTLDGGSRGTNRLVGGLGDDEYHIRNNTTTVVENANQGTDTAHVYIDNYTLAANVENMDLHEEAKTATGNVLANVIDASQATGDIVIHGGANTAGLMGDTIRGGSGKNQIYSYNATDRFENLKAGDVIYISYEVVGASNRNFSWANYFSARGINVPTGVEFVYRGNPTDAKAPAANITGTANATDLVGTNRADTITAAANTASTIDGGAGADVMTGSSQGDVFYVDNAGIGADREGIATVANDSQLANLGDMVKGNGGQDTIRSTVNIDLNRKWRITNTVTAYDQFTDISTVELQGTAALSAKGNASAATTLIGNAGNNALTGGDLGDLLDGGAGADNMTGGRGDDTYYIDNAGDRVTELANGGQDSIITNGIAINLGAANHGGGNVESVRNTGNKTSLTGSGDGIRTMRAESFTAGNFGDTIDGKGGADTITGGEGNDNIIVNKLKSGDSVLVNANDGNDFVEIDNVVSGSSVSVDGGSGNDTIKVQGISGSVTLNGGDGDDRFRFANIESGAAITVNGGDFNDNYDNPNENQGDRLLFDSDKNIGLTLTANGQVGTLQIGSDTVNITTTGINRYFTGAGDVSPVIDDTPISKITKSKVISIVALLNNAKRKWGIGERANRPLAPATIVGALSFIRAAIGKAIENKEWFGENPFDPTDSTWSYKPTHQTRRLRFLTREEAKQLLDELSKRDRQMHDMVLLSLRTGLRPTEIFRLVGTDLDINASVLHILAKGKKRVSIKIPADMMDMLASYNRGPAEPIFQRPKLKIAFKSTPNTFNTAIRRLGLQPEDGNPLYHITFHTMRHTFASWLAQSGKVTLLELQKLMRHQKIEMTLRYAHLIPGQESSKLSIIDEFLDQ